MDERRVSVVRELWCARAPEVRRLLRRIWEVPELPNMEHRAAALLCDWLEANGFEVERGACAIPTAFIARYRRGRGPCVALLAEYDALPGTDNDAVSERKPLGKAAGHACAHNQIGAANAGAAIAARYAMESLGVAGELRVLGTPAEEIVWGKVAMLARGAFDSIDALLTSHADERNGVASQPCMSVVSGELVFRGVSRHGGSPSKANALDAAELAVQSVERLRAHHFPETNAEHVLRRAGQIPNVTPDETRLWVSTRHPSYERAREVYRFIVGVCEQVAATTGATFREQFIAGSRGYLPNDVLAKAVYRELERVGPPAWSAADLDWLAALVEAFDPRAALDLHRDIALVEGGCDFYGQDDGEASWRIPLARVNWAAPRAIPFHNWALTAWSGHPASHPGALMASEALALAAVSLLAEPQTLAAAKAELAERVAGRALSAPEYGAARTLTEEPERFWDATWVE